MASRQEFVPGTDAMASVAAWLSRERRPTLVVMAGGKRPATAPERDYQRKLGKVIVELRDMGNAQSGYQKISQAKLAELMDRSEAALSRWECGKATPSAYDLVQLARIFEVPVDALALLIHPPEGPISPVRQMLAKRAAAGARRGLGSRGQERGAA